MPGAASIESIMEQVGAQTQLFARPGAVSFKRLLGANIAIGKAKRPWVGPVEIQELIERPDRPIM